MKSLFDLYRRINWRIIPFLFVCSVVNYIDRTNIGYAKLRFAQDLHFSDAVFGLGAGIFYLGYIFFEIPSNLYLKKVGAKKTLMRIMILWGLASMAMSLTQTTSQFYFTRILLGAAEAGFFPGVMLYLTYWYPAQRRAQVNSMIILSILVSGIIGGLISGSIMAHTEGVFGLHGWQILFLVEGAPAILLGLCVPFVLSDRPETANWLQPEDVALIRQQLNEEVKNSDPSEVQQPLELLKSAKAWLLIIIYIFLIAGSSILTTWMPTIIKETGQNSLSLITSLSAIPYCIAAITMLVLSRNSDLRMERRWHLAGCLFIASMSFLFLGRQGDNISLTLLTLSLATAAIYSALPIFWSYSISFFGEKARAFAIAFINSAGVGLGGFGCNFLVGQIKQNSGSITLATSLVGVGLMVCFLLQVLARPALTTEAAKTASL